MTQTGLDQARQKMRRAGVPDLAITVFTHYYTELEAGETGMLPEESILPFTNPVAPEALEYSEEDQRQALQQTVVIKLNGGLGTSMGLDKAKTLLKVRRGLNFLDIIALQILSARKRYGADLPVIFMNSFRTDADTLEALRKYPDLPVDGLALSFLQTQEPRLHATDLSPLEGADDPEIEWCPPGHGDIFTSLQTTGLLDRLLERGVCFAQVSNGDNLGATPNGVVAAWFAQSGAPFAMEVCARSTNDRKGGHLARWREGGGLLLREFVQTPPDDASFFMDEHRHPYFNTNTVWLNLHAIRDVLAQREGVMGLPLIRNEKVIETLPDRPTVVQIETAMGAAISVLPGSSAVLVGRERFIPVKTTNELLLLRSDAFELAEDGSFHLAAPRLPRVVLEPTYYGRIDRFDARIPVAPSLVAAQALTVEGDWTFMPGAVVTGEMTLGPEGGIYG